MVKFIHYARPTFTLRWSGRYAEMRVPTIDDCIQMAEELLARLSQLGEQRHPSCRLAGPSRFDNILRLARLNETPIWHPYSLSWFSPKTGRLAYPTR